jgi:hypothetical protein
MVSLILKLFEPIVTPVTTVVAALLPTALLLSAAVGPALG